MKIVLISDTHGKHHELHDSPHIKSDFWKGDAIVHAGDVGEGLGHTLDFLDWYEKLNFTYKIFIAGNHDRWIENYKERFREELVKYDVIYLENEARVLGGVKFYGSPWSRNLPRWAFQLDDEDAEEEWMKIHYDTDVLITHGPAQYLGDRVKYKKPLEPNNHVGCPALREAIKSIKPKLHVVGHIHEDRGTYEVGDTKVVNASVLDYNYQLYAATPFVVEI